MSSIWGHKIWHLFLFFYCALPGRTDTMVEEVDPCLIMERIPSCLHEAIVTTLNLGNMHYMLKYSISGKGDQ